MTFEKRWPFVGKLRAFFKTKISLTNFMCQIFFRCAMKEFLTSLSKILSLHGENMK